MVKLEEIISIEGDSNDEMESPFCSEVEKYMQHFELAFLDDLSTCMPRAAASLFGVVKVAEKELKKEDNLDVTELALMKRAIEQIDKVCGIFYKVPISVVESEIEKSDVSVPDDVMKLVKARADAKETKGGT